MRFNHELVVEFRRRESMRTADFARLLGISKSQLSQMENSGRKPSFEVIDRLVMVTGIPIEKWLIVGPAPDAPSNEEVFWHTKSAAHEFTDMKNRLNREHQGRLKAEGRVWELEQTKEHLTAAIRLHAHFDDIICDGSLTKYIKMGKLQKLAVLAMTEGELHFDEISRILRVGRSTLRNWLDAEKQAYECPFVDGGEILASSPGEAGLCLHCYDCETFESGDCFGHGDEQRPEDIIDLLDKLQRNGVYDGERQAQIIQQHYGIPMTSGGVAHVKHRFKNNLHIPDDVFYLDMRKKK